jgi:glutathione synthase
MKIAFLLYPTSKVKVDEDSSFWMMRELERRGHRVFYFESRDFFWSGSSARAYLTPARLDEKKGYLPSPLPDRSTDLVSMDCIFIRKEPPFNHEYLHCLQLLDLIKDRVFILNDPQAVALANEKLFCLRFKAFVPESLVTQSIAEAVRFIRQLKSNAVIKPLREKGGLGVVVTSARDRNLHSLLETATSLGREKVLVQKFISADRYGDKRLVILNGKILGAFLRRPPHHDFRANLSVGGSMHRTKVTLWDKKLAEAMAPEFLFRGLYFVGVDVIGRFLTEINVTSPAGIPEVNGLYGVHLEREVADFIESSVKRKIGRI